MTRTQLLKAVLAVVALLAPTASASYAKNLNYRSPSENHPSLGISIHKVNKRNVVANAIDPSTLNFTHGIASGDPYPSSVILWTRCAPSDDSDKSNATVSGTVPLYNHGPSQEEIKVSTSPVCVNWKVTSDAALKAVVSSGQAYTSSDVDYTVKVEAAHLQPFTQYWYQFSVCNSNITSPVGKTKTTPRADDATAKISVAVYSCSNFPFGFFNAYGNPIRKNSIDYSIHLGDYIYEYGDGEYGSGKSVGRVAQPNRTIFTLYDYRARHGSYRKDLDLQLNTASVPLIATWDDHEVSDNGYRDGSSGINNTEASFVKDGGVSVDQRKMNAVRAYFEWMPVRQVDMDDNLRIWRSFSFGNLFDLVILDTRNYDRSITDVYWNTDYVHAISNDAGRSLMGSRQESWFYNSLIESNKRGARWRVIGSQIVFSRLNESAGYGDRNPFDYDAWDGYLANRNRTLKTLYDNNISNNILLSGDSHASWVADLAWLDTKAYNVSTGDGAVGVEFGGSAVSSPSPAGANTTIVRADNSSSWLVGANRELHYSDLYYRGYYELTFTYDQVEARYFGMPTLTTRNPYEIPIANFTVKAGANRITRPVGGGRAFSGALKMGNVTHNNITHNTFNNTWFVSSGGIFDKSVVGV